MTMMTWRSVSAIALCCALSGTALAQIIRTKPPVPSKTSTSKTTPLATKAPTLRIQSVAGKTIKKLGTAPDRDSMVSSLLSNPKTRKSMQQATKGSGLSLGQLGGRTLGGASAGGSPLAAAARSLGETPDNTFEEFGWDAGIEFTPAIPGPLFADAGRPYNLGAMDIRGMRLMPTLSITGMSQRDVICMSIPALADLFVELPAGEATYMIGVQMAPYNLSSISSWLERAPCPIKVRVWSECGTKMLEMTPLSGGPARNRKR